VPWGILIGGEELHNNHHAYGVSAKLSNKWWEFDVGWLYIRTLELLGLAKVRRTAPKTSFNEPRRVDTETLKAVVANRFHVLKLYGNRVVSPVLRAECRDVSGEALARLRRVRKLITSEALALDARASARLKETLESNQTLNTIYEFKERLKGLWSQSAKDLHSGDPLAKLQSWCADAEASGIAALENFAQQLKGYRSQLA
jgi:stearoyl-CoA desaturase (delta-9 desaturase)